MIFFNLHLWVEGTSYVCNCVYLVLTVRLFMSYIYIKHEGKKHDSAMFMILLGFCTSVHECNMSKCV